MRTPFAITLIVLVLLFVISCATKQNVKVEAQNNFNANGTPLSAANSSSQIPATTIVKDIKNKKAQNPTGSMQESAVFSNELLKQKGYNFDFNISNRKNTEMSAYKLQTVDGKEISVNLNQPGNHPCGVILSVPLLQVSEKEMRIISDGKEIVVNRPKDFFAEEIVLTNEKLKGTIRKWSVPIDATPFGISADGKKIYFEYGFGGNEYENEKQVKDLVVEVSETGALQFVPKNDERIIKGKELEGFPKKSEISYRRFSIGNKSFILKFSYPCT